MARLWYWKACAACYPLAASRLATADSAYAGDKLKGALESLGTWTIEIVQRSDAAKGFVLMPMRWVVCRKDPGMA